MEVNKKCSMRVFPPRFFPHIPLKKNKQKKTERNAETRAVAETILALL